MLFSRNTVISLPEPAAVNMNSESKRSVPPTSIIVSPSSSGYITVETNRPIVEPPPGDIRAVANKTIREVIF
ncbi:unnamed protein product [Gongylonema pulchrum]|uniref:Uncharacterized protein n=1 Tax=Gongylonema pulchrum TaxID=637853 RepID=A0A183D120_9BILA|nr:unnamed protein product [Gongylonema pulchrum]